MALAPANSMIMQVLLLGLLFTLSFIKLSITQALTAWTTLFLIWLIATINYRRTRPPGPFPLPIVGNTLMFATATAKFDISAKLMQLTKTYGDVVEFWITGRRFVSLSGPAILSRMSSSPIYHLRGDVEDISLKELVCQRGREEVGGGRRRESEKRERERK